MKPYDYQCILEVDPDAPLSLSAIKFEISKHMEWPVELSFTELRLGVGGQAMKYAAIDWNVDGKVPRKVRMQHTGVWIRLPSLLLIANLL